MSTQPEIYEDEPLRPYELTERDVILLIYYGIRVDPEDVPPNSR